MSQKIYVVNKHGKSLMPCSPRKARLLLKNKKAKIYKREPFTIQLIYGSSGYVQPVTVGIDSGYLNIGYSAITDKEEILGGEVQLLQGVEKRIAEKRQYRRTRRSRKRHRQPRFDNRKKKAQGIRKEQNEKASSQEKQKGWLAPSLQHKEDTHHKVVKLVQEILPVTKLAIEVGEFDIQKIKNPSIENGDYQKGEKFGFTHLRKYIIHRDGHKCQNPNCKNKSKNPVLQVHHIGYWKDDGSDRPDNLITLCTQCHSGKNHQKNGFLFGWEPKSKSFKPETFMNTIKKELTSISDFIVYGSETNFVRNQLKIEKSHHNDAFTVALIAHRDSKDIVLGEDSEGKTIATYTEKIPKRSESLIFEQKRRHDRSIEKFYDAKYHDTRVAWSKNIDKKKQKKQNEKLGAIKSGKQLCSGRKIRNIDSKHNEISLRIYRGNKISKGERRIKKKKYSLSSGDIVLYDNQLCEVSGMQNSGKVLKLKNYTGSKTKTPSPKAVTIVSRRSGLCLKI